MPLARGSGIGISPLFSSPEADSGLSPPGKDGGGDEGSRMQRKHERDESPDEGTQRRWKKKQPSNVDWMLKCKTKLFELKERTAKKAVSDVFLTERVRISSKAYIEHPKKNHCCCVHACMHLAFCKYMYKNIYMHVFHIYIYICI